MLETLQAVVVVTVVALPGGAYTWGFEQSAGAWGAGLADRTLRLIGASALFHALVVPLTTWLYLHQFASGRFARGQLWWPAWPLLIGYVVVPFVIGRVVGLGARDGRSWATVFTGPAPAPRAWDHVFVQRRSAWLRIRLKEASAGTGGWVLGVFGPHPKLDAYASGSAQQADLYLSDTVEVDQATGNFRLDANGHPVLRGVGLLLRYDDILYTEVIWE